MQWHIEPDLLREVQPVGTMKANSQQARSWTGYGGDGMNRA